MVIPSFVRQALAGQPITVYGDGSQRRCFSHVKDVVRALADLMTHPEATGEVFNIGSTEEISIQELAALVRSAAGSSSEIVNVPYEEAYGEGFEDMKRRVPDTSKIAGLLGWAPTFSLEGILTEVVESYRAADAIAPGVRRAA